MEQFAQMMRQVVKPTGNNPVYNCMLAIKSEGRGINFAEAIGMTAETGKPVSANSRFRVGSITKLFTATIILQLVDDSLLCLDDLLFDKVNKETCRILKGLHLFNEIDHSKNISVLHLLQHSTGLLDYFSDDERFVNYVMQHPSQKWDWKRVMEKYFEFELNGKPLFAPGNGFHYADTNYLLLAILIEQITNKPLHQVYRERIITPLGLTDTYLEFYEIPEQTKLVVYPYYGIQSLENINTSFDWGGGGLVSTMADLDIFIRSLMKGMLFKYPETPKLFTRFQNIISGTGNTSWSVQYGLGIQKRDLAGYSFFGHNSAYGSMLFYEPGKDISIILSLNQGTALHKAEWLLKKIAQGFIKE